MRTNTVVERTITKQWTTAEVAEVLQVPISTLHQWAYLGKGPAFRKVGRYRRYEAAAVIGWLESLPAGGGPGLPTVDPKTRTTSTKVSPN